MSGRVDCEDPRPQGGFALSNLNAPTENAAQAVFQVTGKCLLANQSIKRLADLDPEERQLEKIKYEHHLLEAITSALAIEDEFYKGLAIRQVINVCRNANDVDIEKTLFKEVDHHSLREQIVKGAPELASERKKLLDPKGACRPINVHLDGLDRDAIVHLVTKAMRDFGASEREIEGFKDDIKNADRDTMLAKAINWGAPVNFLENGQQWVNGDWKRLTSWQRVKRRFSLLGGSYIHPDGTIELASEARARAMQPSAKQPEMP